MAAKPSNSLATSPKPLANPKPHTTQPQTPYKKTQTPNKHLQAYAHAFNLLPHISFNSTVQSLSLSSDGGVIVTTTSRYDHVMICSGHHVTPTRPQFEGLGGFKGKAMHSIE